MPSSPAPVTSRSHPYLLPGILIAMAVVLGVSGYLYYAQHRDLHVGERMYKLTSIAQLKLEQITSWRRERLSDAGFVRRNAALREDVVAYVDRARTRTAAHDAGEAPPVARMQHGHVHSWLEGMFTNQNYDAIVVCDATGTPVIGLPSRTAVDSAWLRQHAPRAFVSDSIVFTDFERDVRDSLSLAVIAPLRDRQGRPAAVVVFRMNPRAALYPALGRWPVPSQTSETLLMRREADSLRWLSPRRFNSQPPLRATRFISDATLFMGMPGQAISLGSVPDYRGVSVQLVVIRVPDSPWFMLCKTDIDEMYPLLEYYAWVTVIIVLLVLVVAAVVMLLLVRRREERLRAHEREEIRRLNAELEQRVHERTAQLEESNRELEAFSYTVSHDLRAPLRAIDGFARILDDDFHDTLPDGSQRYLDIIRTNTRRMGTLIEDLLGFSRVGRTQLHATHVDMQALVVDVLAELLGGTVPSRIDLHTGTLPPAWGDRILLRMVWMNLLQNAIKFTAHRDIAQIEISGASADGQARYAISDNGAGFDMRHADKLFGVFQRLHSTEEFEGTGVGLAIVHRIVTRHGGRIEAQGTPDVGATFTFTLPISAAPPAASHAADSLRQSALAGQTASAGQTVCATEPHG
jgi:signal transduction histidine kinase